MEEQGYLEMLYNNMYLQNLRFNCLRTNDERKYLEKCVEKYKNYYRLKIRLIEDALERIKNTTINSIFCLNKKYYTEIYIQQLEKTQKYRVLLDNLTVEECLNKDLTKVGLIVDSYFPGFILKPQLLDFKLN